MTPNRHRQWASEVLRRSRFVFQPRVVAASAVATLGNGPRPTQHPERGCVESTQREDIPVPQCLANVAVHLVFSMKDRRPYLVADDIRSEMHRQLGGTSKTLGCPILRVGGVEDHVHLLGSLGRSTSISEWVKELSQGVKTRHHDLDQEERSRIGCV